MFTTTAIMVHAIIVTTKTINTATAHPNLEETLAFYPEVLSDILVLSRSYHLIHSGGTVENG